MKLFLKIIVALVVLVVLFPIILFFLPAPVWQWGITEVLERGTKAEVSWQQPLEYRAGLKPRWRVDGLNISTTDGMHLNAQLDHFILELDLYTVFDRVLTVENFEMAGFNAKFKPKEKEKPSRAKREDTKVHVPDLAKHRVFLEIRRLAISDSQITYNNLEPISINEVLVFENEHKRNEFTIDTAYSRYQLSADGVLPSVRHIVAGEVSPFSIDFKSEALLGGIEGTIGLDGIDSTISLRAQNLEPLSPLVRHKLPDIDNILIDASLKGRFSEIRMPNIKVEIADADFNARAQGSIANLNTLSGLDSQIDIKRVSLRPFLAQYDIALPTESVISGSARLSGSMEKLGVDVEKIQVLGTNINAHISGTSSDIFSANVGSFTISAQSDELADVVNLFVKRKWQPFGAIEAEAILVANGGTWRAELTDANLVGYGKTATAKGSVADIINLKGIDIDIEAGITSLNTINSIPQVNIMDFGPINATAKLVSGDDGALLKLSDIKSHHNSDDSRAELIGVIGDLIRFDKVDLSLSAWVSGLDVLEPFTIYPLPKLGNLRADGRLTRNNSPINIDVSNAVLEGDGIAATGSGRVYDTGVDGRWVYEADVDASADTLKRVDVFFDEEIGPLLPPIGPLKASARVVGDSKLALDVTGNGKWIGSEEKDLDVQFAYNDLVSSNRVLSGVVTGSIPDIGQIFSVDIDDVQIEVGDVLTRSTFSYQHDILSLSELNIMATGGALTGNVQGNFSDVIGLRGLDGLIDIAISEELTSRILARVGLEELFRGGSTTLISQLSSNQRLQVFDGFDLTIGEDQITGNLSIDRQDRVLLTGDVEVVSFEVKDERLANADPAPTKDFLFTNERIPFEMLRQIDVELNAKLNKFRAKFLDLSDTEFDIVAKKGNWQFNGNTLMDRGILNFGIDASRNIPRLSSRINSLGLKAGAFITTPGIDPEELEIPLHIEWDISADGWSLVEIMGSLEGEAQIFGRNIYIGTRMLNLLAGDFATELFGLLDQSEQSKIVKSSVHCIGANSKIKNGIVDFGNDLGIKTDSLIIMGSGNVDLADEIINLEIRSSARKGIGLSASAIVQFISLGGTFTNPRIAQSGDDIFRNTLLGTLAFVTAGTSAVITGVLGRIGSDEDICEHAYSGQLTKNIEEAAAQKNNEVGLDR